MTSAAEHCKRYDALEAERAPWIPQWNAVRKYCHPGKVAPTNKPSGAGPRGVDDFARLFDSSSVSGCQELAAAFVHWLCDPSEIWFRLDSPVDNGDAKQACDLAGKAMREALAASNFYVAIHQMALERCGPGTGCLVVGLGPDGLEFESWRVGSYVYWADTRGQLKGWIAKLSLTAEQAMSDFGAECPETVANDASNPTKASTKHEFLRVIWTRTADELARVSKEAVEAGSPMAMPIGSCWIHKATKRCVKESGMMAMPVAVSPYEVWPADESSSEPWGYSPGWWSLADARTANQLRQYSIEHAALASGPRVIVPTSHQGPVDLGRHGVTRVKDMARERPTEWGQVADIRSLSVELDRCRADLDRHWQGQLVRQIGSLEREVTATQVRALQDEALRLFAPTVSLMLHTALTPILDACFSLLYYAGALPEFPESMRVDGRQVPPKVRFTSRMILALEALQVGGFAQCLAEAVQLQAGGVQVIDNLKVDEGFRDLCRGRGVDPSLLVSERDRDEGRQRQAEAAAQQQETAVMLEAAKTPVARELAKP